MERRICWFCEGCGQIEDFCSENPGELVECDICSGSGAIEDLDDEDG